MTSYFTEGIRGEYEMTRVIKIVMIPCISASIMNILCYGISDKEFRDGLTNFKSFRKKQMMRSRRMTIAFYAEQHQKQEKSIDLVLQNTHTEDSPKISSQQKTN